jgi:hypothetical protein
MEQANALTPGREGWTSIRIYTMACLPDGRTLDQLRDPVEPDTGPQ